MSPVEINEHEESVEEFEKFLVETEKHECNLTRKERVTGGGGDTALVILVS
jgi:hypothetical protein